MTPAFNLRSLEWRDLSELSELYYSYHEELKVDREFGLILSSERPSHADQIQWFSRLVVDIERGHAFATVAELDGRVTGLCEVRTRGPNAFVRHTAVVTVGVRRENRRGGIGSSLLVETLRRCPPSTRLIDASFPSTNVAAKALLTKHGFRTYGVIPGFVYRSGRYLDLERMYLVLHPDDQSNHPTQRQADQGDPSQFHRILGLEYTY